MKIDAHQHFWSLERGDYGWLTPDLAPLYRDFMPRDLSPLLRDAGIDGTVLVQAAPTLAETEFLLGLAEKTEFIMGVVGWVDFEAPDAVEVISRLAAHPYLVGLRPMIQDIPDPEWMLRRDFGPVFQAMVDHDLTFDALTLPQHLGNLRKLLDRHPSLNVVIDHASKPQIRENKMDGWSEDMAALARETNAYCKLSGMVTEARADWSVATLKPFADHVLDGFGAERLIWGSDWPVCTMSASYGRWYEASLALLGDCTSAELEAVYGGNAHRAYRLSASRASARRQ